MQSSFTKYGWFLCLWVLLIPFQYGYHISVLNQIHSVLSCNQNLNLPEDVSSPYHPTFLPTCIPMSDWTFSAITAIFTLGGLTGSLLSNVVMDRYGRKGAARISAVFVTLGTGLMGVSGGVIGLGLGRFLVGVGSGVGLCVAPIYISEIAPSRISGTVGVLTQLGIVVGIFLTQLLGLTFATPSSWRLVLFFSFVLAVAQWALSGLMVDTPGWTSGRFGKEEAARVEQKIWGTTVSSFNGLVSQSSETESIFEASSDHGSDHPTITVTHPLLSEPDESQTHVIHSQNQAGEGETINLPTLLLHTPRDVRRPMLIVCCAMLGQQLSGINAILYYSNEILSKSLPEFGPYVSLGITVVNVIMTFPPIILIEKLGRRQLLTISTLGALLSLCAVGIGLNAEWVALASGGIIVFVMSFAIGLGPIPFIMIPEVSPFYAVSALSSLALSLNWIANFLVGLIFLPLRNILSGGDADKEGRVFWVFAVVLALVMGVVRVSYRS